LSGTAVPARAGSPPRGQEHAAGHVAVGGDGVLREARLYQLARISGTVRERLIEVDFARAGVEAYAFTFG
jgi:hypothetical protein